MSEPTRISRRTVLRGLGTAIALPWLETFVPRHLRGAEPAAGEPGGPINRMVVVYVPNGVHMPAWKPALAGDDYVLPYILEPLAPLQCRLNVISGLALDKARANGDGGGVARPLAGRIFDRLPGQEDAGGRHPRRRFGRSVGGPADRRTDPFCFVGIGLRRGPPDRQLRHRL